MAVDARRQAVPPEAFLEELEGLRQAYLGGRLLRPPKHYASKEEVAAAKRRGHVGSNGANHKFEGERYLNCPDKAIRRKQLRKLIDEGGQQTVGVGLPSHETLARWESYEFGLTDEEIDRLQMEELAPETFIWQGWRTAFHRRAHWAVGMGSSLVGEGEKRVPELLRKLQDEIVERRKQYAEWGIKDLDRALASAVEHAGVDVEHSEFGADVTRRFVTTPELQDELRRGFILTMHLNGF
jgi:pyrroloquinoline quinone (PQQ) biosynthesis protein C